MHAIEFENWSNRYETSHSRVKSPSQEFDLDMYLLLVKFRKADYSINRYKFWKVMTLLRILANLVMLVNACVQHSKCKIKFNAKFTKEFFVEIVLSHGDLLSSTLFNIGIESVIKDVTD